MNNNKFNCIYTLKLIIIILFIFIININYIYAQQQSDSNNNNNNNICRGDLIYRDVSNREEDEKIGFNFIKYNDTYISCVVPCPSPFFKLEDWNMFLTMSKCMGTISFFSGLFLLISYSPLVNRKHNRHTIGVLCMSFGVCMAMCTDFYSFGHSFEASKPEKSLCLSPGQYLTSNDAKCVSSGILLEFGGVFGFMWWTILSYDIYQSIKGRTQRKNYDKYYIIVTLAISILFSLVPLANDQYSMSYIGLGCWLGDAVHQLALFWIGLSLCLITSSIFIILILKEIHYIIKVSNQKSSLKGNIRPLLCIIITGFAFFYMFFYYLSIAVDQDYYESVLDDYVKCLIESDDITKCSAAKFSVAGNFIFLFCLRLLGIGAFIFYGINNKVKKIWLESFWFNNSFVNKYISHSSSNSNSSNNNNNNGKNSSSSSSSGMTNISTKNNLNSNSNIINTSGFDSSVIEMSIKEDSTSNEDDLV